MRICAGIIMLLALSPTAQASTCDESSATSSDVTVAYVGNTTLSGIGWSIPQGKYLIHNGSSGKVQIAGYKTQPLTIYRHDTSLEKKSSGGSWASDVTTLEELLPPNKTVTLKPGQQVEFAAEFREDEKSSFRFRVRLKNGCWVSSAPFQFAAAK